MAQVVVSLRESRHENPSKVHYVDYELPKKMFLTKKNTFVFPIVHAKQKIKQSAL